MKDFGLSLLYSFNFVFTILQHFLELSHLFLWLPGLHTAFLSRTIPHFASNFFCFLCSLPSCHKHSKNKTSSFSHLLVFATHFQTNHWTNKVRDAGINKAISFLRIPGAPLWVISQIQLFNVLKESKFK